MHNKETVQSLRKQKYKVRVTSYRCYHYINNASAKKVLTPNPKITRDLLTKRQAISILGSNYIDYLSPKEGKTLVEITTPEKKESSGLSICGRKDIFNKKIGTHIALQRALFNLTHFELKTPE